MTLPPRLLLSKGLHWLERGDLVRAEAVLRQAARAGEQDADPVTWTAALCCLGELIARQQRPVEAAETLRACLAVPVPDEFDDVCANEHTRARQLLAALSD